MVETIHQVKPFKALTAMRGKPIKKAKKRKPSYDDSSEEVSDIDWAFESDDMVKRCLTSRIVGRMLSVSYTHLRAHET